MDLNIELNGSRVERYSKRTKAIACATVVFGAVGYAWGQATAEKLSLAKGGHPIVTFAGELDKASKAIKDLNTDSGNDCSKDLTLTGDVQGKCALLILTKMPAGTITVPTLLFEDSKKEMWKKAHDKLKKTIGEITGLSSSSMASVLTTDHTLSDPSNDVCIKNKAFSNAVACLKDLRDRFDGFAPISKAPFDLADSCANGTFSKAIKTCEKDAGKATCKTALQDILKTNEAKALLRWEGNLTLVEEKNIPEVKTCLQGVDKAVGTIKDFNKAELDAFAIVTAQKRTSNLLLIIGISVVALLLVGVGVYFFMKKKKAEAGAAQPDAGEA